MNSRFLGLVLFLCAAQFATAQQEASKCDLTLTQAPAVHGVRLGMTSKEVVNVLKVDLPARPYPYAFRASKLESSKYFRDKWSSKDSLLFAILQEPPHKVTYPTNIPILMVDLNYTQIGALTDDINRARAYGLDGVTYFKVDLRDDRVIGTQFIFESDALIGLGDTDRIKRLSEMLKIPERFWSTDNVNNKVVCGKAFDVVSFVASRSKASHLSVSMVDLKALEQLELDAEEWLRLQYESRQKAAVPATGKPASN